MDSRFCSSGSYTLQVNKTAYPYLEQGSSLPRLPVPSLDHTLNKYLTTVQALLLQNKDTDGTKKFEQTKKLVQKFLSDPQQAPLLHQELLNLDKESPTSWLEGWWDTMYLEIRDPIPINVNPAFGLEDNPRCTDGASRAASLTVASLNFFLKIKNGQLQVDKEKDTPLDMSQFGRLFGTSRIPNYKRDKLLTYAESRHIIVMYQGSFHYLEVLHSDTPSGKLVPVPESVLHKRYQEIIQEGKRSRAGIPIGILTTEDRNLWASVRGSLESHSRENAESLQMIDSSLFVVCIDDDRSSSFEDLSRELLHSDGTNRWFDKSIQIIVNESGKAGINMEHSGFDGHTVIQYLDHIHQDSMKQQVGSTGTDTSLLHHKKLNFNVPLSVAEQIQMSKVKFLSFCDKTQTSLLNYDKYGKSKITSELKISPDAFVQMAFQLTYYRIYGYLGSAYESASTKQFYHGRTECLRSVSNDSIQFCKTYMNGSIDNATKATMLRNAAKTHVKLMNEAKNGNGIDRHLWGMMHLASQRQQRIPGYQIPEIYSDPTWSLMRTDLLSTSNCGNSSLSLFGFGPVVDNGFGLGYIIKNNSIVINVTSFIGEANRYAKELSKSFDELYNLLRNDTPRSKL